MMKKICLVCKEEKDISNFQKNGGNRWRPKCKSCQKIHEIKKPQTKEQKEKIKINRINKIEEKNKNLKSAIKNINIIRKSLISFLNENKSFKYSKIIKSKILYSVEDLRKNIESKFEPWMNWKNFSSYDHKNWKDSDLSTWTWDLKLINNKNFSQKIDLFSDEFQCCIDFENIIPVNSKRYHKEKKDLHYEHNKEKINANYKLKRKNPEYRIKQNLKTVERRKNNIEYFKKRDKASREKYKDKIKADKKQYEKKRLQNDINFKLRKIFSNAIFCALKRNQSSKNNNSILQFLPYSIQELKEHIISLFEPWMSWNNWGVYNPKTWDDHDQSTWKWQLDHIIPKSNFKYESMDSEEFRQCWSLQNLRPLSAKQNIIEQDRKI